MKPIKFSAWFLLISLICTISPAMAQEADPPDSEQLEPPSEGPLDMAALEALGIDKKFDESSQDPTWEAPPPDNIESNEGALNGLTVEEPQQPLVSPSDFAALPGVEGTNLGYLGPDEPLSRDAKEPKTAAAGGDRWVKPLTGYIPIADSNSVDEETPAIAHGDNFYMVFYLVNGDVYARVYNNNGVYYIGGLVYNGPNDCRNLSAAYESQTGLFVVTFQHYNAPGDYHIYARAVSPYSGPVGTTKYIANTLTNETEPNIACNARVGNCLVAYEYNNGNDWIMGKFLYINNTNGVNGWSVNQYQLSSAHGRNPYLAWGINTGTYFLTYAWWYSGTSEWFPAYTHLYDVYVSGTKYLYINHSLVPFNWDPGYDKRPLDVTYDPCTKRYVVLFYHEFQPSDWDIWMAHVNNAGVVSGKGPVAATIDFEYDGDAQFVTDDHKSPFCNMGDRVVVTYKNATDGIYAADLRGNNNPSNAVYHWDTVSKQYLVAPDGTGYTGYAPVIASGVNNKMFIAWEYDFSGDEDIWGRLIITPWQSFVPILRKW